MCGIFAYLSESIESGIHDKFDQIKHRGPDHSDTLLKLCSRRFVFLGFHRLSINGVSMGNQPMKYKQFVLVCNGEIYNYKSLAKTYDITLTTGSDCEVLLPLYEKLGPSMVSLLDGVFSLIIFDESNEEVFVSRDPYGIRSLYWGYDENGLGFSSEMKSLTQLTQTISQFPPGCYVEFSANLTSRPEPIRYFMYDYTPVPSSSIQTTIRSLLTRAVEKRLIGERTLGCLLSGGLDSSLIAALVCQFRDPETVHTFSIGFEGSPDILASRQVAKFLNTTHHECILTPETVFEALPSCIYQIESHDVTTIRASVSMYLLSQFIRDTTDVKIILSGEGSDEASGSYLYFHKAPDPLSFQTECVRLLQDVYLFDALRADKTTAGCGLEVRVPFFDKDFLQFYMGIDPSLKMPKQGHEKYLLRKSFESYLPEEIVWRRKDGFSDGVSCHEKPLYSQIDEFTQNTKGMSEKEYYESVFQTYYKGHESTVPYQWLPKWCGDVKNPSNRLFLNEISSKD